MTYWVEYNGRRKPYDTLNEARAAAIKFKDAKRKHIKIYKSPTSMKPVGEIGYSFDFGFIWYSYSVKLAGGLYHIYSDGKLMRGI